MKPQTQQPKEVKTDKQIEDEVYNAYCDEGQSQAFKMANKYGSRIEYERCPAYACDTETPTIKGKHTCLICGQETKPIPTTEAQPKEVLQLITGILDRKRKGNDCTEYESAELKMFIKETKLPGSGEQQLIEDIQLLFPLEYGEALDEMERDTPTKEVLHTQGEYEVGRSIRSTNGEIYYPVIKTDINSGEQTFIAKCETHEDAELILNACNNFREAQDLLSEFIKWQNDPTYGDLVWRLAVKEKAEALLRRTGGRF